MAYDAFISYSHSEDLAAAEGLHNSLQRFAKPWYKLRALRIFRDVDSLEAANNLTAAIRKAIATSRYFILLASDKSAKSPWVAREVGLWLEADPQCERLLLVLSSGDIAWKADSSDFDWERTTALPDVLRGKFKAEPLHIDLRAAKGDTALAARDPRFQLAIARLAARIHGKSLDEISGQEVLEHRRTLRIAWTAVMLIGGLAAFWAIAAWTAVQQRRAAESNFARAYEGTDVLVEKIALGMIDNRGMATRATLDVLLQANQIMTGLSKEIPRQSRVAHWLRGKLRMPDNAPNLASLLELRARSLNGLSQVHIRAGCAMQAVAYADDAIKLLQDNRAALSSNGLAELPKALLRKGEATRNAGDWPAALAMFQEGARVADEYPRGQVSNDVIREVARCRIAASQTIAYLEKDLVRARQGVMEAIAAFRTIVASRPDVLSWQSDLGDALVDLGDLLKMDGQNLQAEQAYREAGSILDQVTKRAPENRSWLNNAITARLHLGELMLGNGQSAPALEIFMESLAPVRSLVEDDPGNANFQARLAEVDARIADAYAHEERWSEAVESYGGAVQVYDRLLRRPTCEAVWASYHAQYTLRLAHALERSGTRDRAAAAYASVLTEGRNETACRKHPTANWGDLRAKAAKGLAPLIEEGDPAAQSMRQLLADGNAGADCSAVCAADVSICR
jgi:tetratricopeptide (TPR) repeat protein